MRLCLWRFTGGSTLAWLFYMWDPLRSGASNKGQDQGNTHPTNGHLLRGEYPEYTDRNGRRGGGGIHDEAHTPQQTLWAKCFNDIVI